MSTHTYTYTHTHTHTHTYTPLGPEKSEKKIPRDVKSKILSGEISPLPPHF